MEGAIGGWQLRLLSQLGNSFLRVCEVAKEANNRRYNGALSAPTTAPP